MSIEIQIALIVVALNIFPLWVVSRAEKNLNQHNPIEMFELKLCKIIAFGLIPAVTIMLFVATRLIK